MFLLENIREFRHALRILDSGFKNCWLFTWSIYMTKNSTLTASAVDEQFVSIPNRHFWLKNRYWEYKIMIAVLPTEVNACLGTWKYRGSMTVYLLLKDLVISYKFIEHNGSFKSIKSCKFFYNFLFFCIFFLNFEVETAIKLHLCSLMDGHSLRHWIAAAMPSSNISSIYSV